MKKTDESNASNIIDIAFELDAKELIKLIDSLKSKFKKTAEISIKIELANRINYSVENVEEIQKEDNKGTKKITEISINFEEGDFFEKNHKEVSIKIKKGYPVGRIFYSIDSYNKNWTSETLNLIEERINNFKKKYSFIYKIEWEIFMMFPISAILTWLLILTTKAIFPNLLLNTTLYLTVFTIFIISFITSPFILTLIQKLFPPYIFVFGEEINRLEKIKSIRIWVLRSLILSTIFTCLVKKILNL